MRQRNYRKFEKNVNYKSISNYGIVLDLDETLIKSKKFKVKVDDDVILGWLMSSRMFEIKLVDCTTPKGEGDIYYMKVLKRYGLDEFLDWCHKYFRVVIVYSAGKERYVEAIVDGIFKYDKHPYLVYHRDNCSVGSTGDTLKPLVDMYAENPELNDIVPIQRMFCLDDNDYTYENNPHNGILIPKFSPFKKLSEVDDNELFKVITYVESFRYKDSIY